MDKKCEDFFNKVLEGIVSIREKDGFKGQDFALGDLVNKYFMEREAAAKDKLLAHTKEIASLYNKIDQAESNMASLRMRMNSLASKFFCFWPVFDRNSAKIKEMKLKESMAANDANEDEVCVFQYMSSKHRVDLAEKVQQYEEWVFYFELLLYFFGNFEPFEAIG